MRTAVRRILLVAAVAPALGAALPAWAAEEGAGFALSEVFIDTGNEAHRFTVEVARTPTQRARGLMYRHDLPPEAGMLFDFGAETEVAMWMKNTLIPLDMLFIGADGRIAKIAEHATPHSLDLIRSGAPVRAVLELNAGTARRLGIETGDRVLHPIFGTRR